jgi:TRAP transporter TAXI family solute receptor
MRRSILLVGSLVLLASYPVVAEIAQHKSASSEGASGAVTLPAPGPEHAKTTAPRTLRAMREMVNSGLVGLISEGIDGSGLAEATELAASFDGVRDHLRILPIAGKGALQNVTDIVFARGIDIGIIQSDVLAALKRNPPFPRVESFLQYITRLYDEEVHVLAAKGVNSTEDLASKKVNFGLSGSGTDMTASVIFERLGINVDVTNFSQSVALEKLRRGEIAAMVYVAGKPSRLFGEIRPDEGLHFLPVAATTDLSESYTRTSLTAEDYPELIDAERPVATVAVSCVLVAYNWPAGTERYRRVAHFVQAFFDRHRDLQTPQHHPKWRDIDIPAAVPGWTRFAPAEQWIRKAGLDSGEPSRHANAQEAVPGVTRVAVGSQMRDTLFREFVEYQKQQAPVIRSAAQPNPQKRELLIRDFVEYIKGQTNTTISVGSLDQQQRDALFAQFVQ